MRIFKTVYFHKFAQYESITDSTLKHCIKELEKGLHDGDLGGYVFKKRISRKNQGKRAGFRSIIGYKSDDRAIFMYGYAKNAKDNVNVKELEGFRELSKHYFSLNEKSICQLLKMNQLIEVKND